MSGRKYEYILIDADNTLFDFDRSEREALLVTFEQFNIKLGEDDIVEYHHINDGLWKKLERGETTREKLKIQRFSDFISHLGIDNVDASVAAERYILNLSEQSFLLDGAYDLCLRISAKYPLYLITNGITVVQKKRFSRSSISSFFKDIFISEEMGVTKPDAGYFRKVAETVGESDPGKYLVIGDSLSSDIQGAINFGCDSVLLSKSRITDKRPTYIVSELSEIDRVLLLSENNK